MARIITSPGVQITEKDLSLRIQTPAGTHVYVPGFAAQGPVSEPIQITSISEFEAIYGTPTTAAERYFYYSCKEVLNSPAVLNTLRLPYGQDAGTSYSNAYSALLYPVLLNDNTWTVGAAKHITLTSTQYSKILQGDFEWTGTGGGTFQAPGDQVDISAGIIILNDLQTSINELGEGYYVGLTSNKAADPTSAYDSILEVRSLSGTDQAYLLESANSSTTRLDFALSATKFEADRGLNSISEALESVGFIGFEGDEYQDHISLGIFKIRRSTANPGYLSLGTTERYIGSLNASRKTASPTGGSLLNAFISEVASSSPTIKVLVNPEISTANWSERSNVPTTGIDVSSAAKSLYPLGVYVSDTTADDTAKVIGSVPLKLDKALRMIENPENVTVDVLIDAGLSTIYSTSVLQSPNANVSYNEDYYINNPSNVTENWRSVVNVLINFSENTRKDCFTIIDLPRPIFIAGKDSKVINIEGNSFTLNIYNPIRECIDGIETNYAATYANWIKNADLYSGKRIWLPPSGYAAAVFGRSDAAANTWAAPAGFNRGTINNLLDIAFNPNQKQRDRLYEIASNPIVFFSGDGYTVFGQKTLQNKPTAFDRINVRRLFLTLERAVSKTVKYFVFEPNTSLTRKKLVATISPIFNYAKTTEGVYDFLIVADERNNTPDSIDNNELIVDIYIKPVRTAEFILVNFIATRTGQNFQELI